MKATLLITAVAGLALAACSREPSAPGPSSAANVPAGAYSLDAAHSTLTFRVSHLGFSSFTGEFKQFDAQLQFDPQNVPASQVTVTVDPRSLDVPRPPEGFIELLLNDEWLAAARYPEMTFRSKQVEEIGPDRMRIHGELELKGITQPVTLDATFNGGYAGHPLEPRARIGFSARGTLKRSAFGIKIGVPEPGSTFGVGDDVEIIIETELTGPPLAKARS